MFVNTLCIRGMLDFVVEYRQLHVWNNLTVVYSLVRPKKCYLIHIKKYSEIWMIPYIGIAF